MGAGRHRTPLHQAPSLAALKVQSTIAGLVRVPCSPTRMSPPPAGAGMFVFVPW